MDVELSSPASTERLHELLDEYKEYRVTDDPDKPGESIGLYAARENLTDYLDEHYDGDTDWKEIYKVIKGDNIMVNRYWAFVEVYIKREEVIKAIIDGTLDECDYEDEYVTCELVETIELPWGECDLVFEHDSLFDKNTLTFGTLSIDNCPPIEELEQERVELAIIGYLSVCDNYDVVYFDYNKIEDEVKEYIAEINA